MNNLPVRISADSVCDLPVSIANRFGITVFNYLVLTEHGRFIDNKEIGSEDLLNYIKDETHTAKSHAPKPEEYRHFFEKMTENGSSLVHISMAKGSSKGYQNALQAAEGLPVSVIDSGSLSSTMGLIAIRAAELAILRRSREDIVKETIEYAKHQRCTFLVKNPNYLFRSGRLSRTAMDFSQRFVIRPVLKMKNSSIHVKTMVAGEWEWAMKRYVDIALHSTPGIDNRLVFITHVGLHEDQINEIKKEISRCYKFQEMIEVDASAAICCNCGEGTFGILFARGKAIHVPKDQLFWDEEKEQEEILPEIEDEIYPINSDPDVIPEIHQTEAEKKTMLAMQLAALDVPAGLLYCGDNVELYMEILNEYCKVNKTEMLDNYLKTENWENYRISIHALKSSSKTIGAMELFEEARLLEMACKEGNYDYIREHHALVMLSYNTIYQQCKDIIINS